MKYVRLSEVAEINPRQDKVALSVAQEVSFVAMADVSEQTCSIVSETDKAVEDVSKGFTFFAKRDVLLAKITPCFENGKVAVADINNDYGFGSTEFHVIRANPELLDSRYIYYLLRSQAFKAEGAKNMTGSAGQKRVPKSFLERYKIPLPPLEEQKRIAQVLDKADSLRQKDRQLLAHYDQLLQSVFLDMFGDPVNNEKYSKVLAREFLSVKGGYAFKSSDFVDEGIPLIKIGNINKGIFDNSSISFLPFEFESKYKKFLVYPGDLVLSLTGTVGKDDYGNICRIPIEVDGKFLLNQRVAKLALKSTVNANYVSYLFKQDEVKKLMTKNSRGIRQANLNNDDILNLFLPVPPIEVQDKFSDIVENIERLKTKTNKSLINEISLSQSLLQKAFKGELQLKEEEVV